MSNGEKKIISILVHENIAFEREKTFNDLRQGKFRYDFFIPSKKILIEMNGEQHYYQVEHFQKTRREFLKQQENDRRKISYALANGYAIYCIPFWEIDSISSVSELLNEKYRALSRWKNDIDWNIKINYN